MASRHLAYHVLDVFTSQRFSGNPLAVVTGADDLKGDAMQTIAAEFNLSETIFVMAPETDGHEARVRIFTPRHEMDFAGHPTIGCAIHLAERHWPKGAFDETLILEEKAGHVPVQVRRERGAMSATFTAPVIPFPRGVSPSASECAAALGLGTNEVRSDHSARVHEGGPSFLYVPLVNADALARARPVGEAFKALTEACDCHSVYCYVHEGTEVRSRMFAPAAGIPEDAATGSAAAILASQLLDLGSLEQGTNTLTVTQGVEMGRPSEIGLEIDVADGEIGSVRVTGSAVRVADGQILV